MINLENEPSLLRKCTIRLLPRHLNVGDETRHEYQVDRTDVCNLVRDAYQTVRGISSLG